MSFSHSFKQTMEIYVALTFLLIVNVSGAYNIIYNTLTLLLIVNVSGVYDIQYFNIIQNTNITTYSNCFGCV